jgi:hypothetical protein
MLMFVIAGFVISVRFHEELPFEITSTNTPK